MGPPIPGVGFPGQPAVQGPASSQIGPSAQVPEAVREARGFPSEAPQPASPMAPQVDVGALTQEVQRRILSHLERERERGASIF